jgi:hypothetical protein
MKLIPRHKFSAFRDTIISQLMSLAIDGVTSSLVGAPLSMQLQIMSSVVKYAYKTIKDDK